PRLWRGKHDDMARAPLSRRSYLCAEGRAHARALLPQRRERPLRGLDGADTVTRTTAGECRRILVGIATAGRAEILSETLAELCRQTRLPDRVVICPANPGDIEPQVHSLRTYPIEIVWGTPGSSSQRNAILRSS